MPRRQPTQAEETAATGVAWNAQGERVHPITGHPVCGARRRKPFTLVVAGVERECCFCSRRPVEGRTRCHLHGGKSRTGLEVGTFKHGRYSTYFAKLPKELRKGYQEALEDSELTSLRDELAVIQARISQVLGALADAPPVPWTAIKSAYDQVLKTAATDPQPALKALGEVIEKGGSAAAVQARGWVEIRELIQEKTATSRAEWKRMNELNAVITVDQALLFGRALLAAVDEHVLDPNVVRAIKQKALHLMPLTVEDLLPRQSVVLEHVEANGPSPVPAPDLPEQEQP